MGGLTPVLEFNKMRKNIVAGNWKMNLNRVEAIALVDEVLKTLLLFFYILFWEEA